MCFIRVRPAREEEPVVANRIVPLEPAQRNSSRASASASASQPNATERVLSPSGTPIGASIPLPVAPLPTRSVVPEANERVVAGDIPSAAAPPQSTPMPTIQVLTPPASPPRPTSSPHTIQREGSRKRPRGVSASNTSIPSVCRASVHHHPHASDADGDGGSIIYSTITATSAPRRARHQRYGSSTSVAGSRSSNVTITMSLRDDVPGMGENGAEAMAAGGERGDAPEDARNKGDLKREKTRERVVVFDEHGRRREYYR